MKMHATIIYQSMNDTVSRDVSSINSKGLRVVEACQERSLLFLNIQHLILPISSRNSSQVEPRCDLDIYHIFPQNNLALLS